MSLEQSFASGAKATGLSISDSSKRGPPSSPAKPALKKATKAQDNDINVPPLPGQSASSGDHVIDKLNTIMNRMERMVVKDDLVGLVTKQDLEEVSVKTDRMINKLQDKVDKEIKAVQQSVQPLQADMQAL